MLLAPALPTDRDKVAPDLGVGVDTVAVQGPTTEALLASMREQVLDRAVDWETGAFVDTHKLSTMLIDVGYATARLHGFRQSGLAWLRIELSLPTMLNGHNRNPLGLDVFPDAVEASLILVREQLPDVPEVEQVNIQRLDLPRDFHNVQSTHTVLSALHRRHIPHARVNDPHFLSDGTMQSLARGSRSSWIVRGYDKGRELSQHARRDRARRPLLDAWAQTSHGHLRFESQLRAPLLRQKGITTVSDAPPALLEELAQERFAKARWAEPYGGRGRVQRTLEALRPSLTSADYRNLCCYVFCTTHRMDLPLSRHAIERVRPFARRHNLLDPEDDHEHRRLDFESGQEVLAD